MPGYLLSLVFLSTLFLLVACSGQSSAVPVPESETLIRLTDPLDEPEYYCVDVTGFGANLDLDGPLQAHTCKPGAEDELFTFNDKRVRMDAYDVCLEYEAGQLFVRSCNDSQEQQFTLVEDGTIRTADNDLCMTVASGGGQPAGGRSHLRRDLLLESCSGIEPSLSKWDLPGPRP